MSVIAYKRMRSWNAESYDRVSGPQLAMGRDVVERLPLDGDETVLDAGCGTGRVTALLLERLPRGRVIAVDASPDMVATARANLPESVDVRRADLADFALEEPVDAVLSTATFHWVPDHDALFARLAAALEPGGRLEAQCGGEGNVARLHAVARAVGGAAFEGWPGPWNFSSAELAAERLRRHGFDEVRTWLEPRPVRPEEPREFLRTVVLHPFLARLPEGEREPFLEGVIDRLGEPIELDYVRLNLSARRAT
ncbi:MAG: methyltransferase protein [Solirubrobacterales bacterium]|nr:methyltransferase protein [Solirubrobacterales bacterium]